MKPNWKWISVMGAVAWVGCGGDNVTTRLDGDATDATFMMQLKSSLATQAKLGARALENDDGSFSPGGSAVTITSARVNVKEIRLYLPEGILCAEAVGVIENKLTCEEEIDDSSSDDSAEEIEAKIQLDGPYVFDLFTGKSTPDLSTFSVPSGVFRKVKFKIAEAEAEDGLVAADDLLAGNSIVVEGTFTDSDGASHPFHMALKYNEDFEIEDESGVEILEDSVTALTANFNVETWFAGTDLQACVKDGNLTYDADGVLVIDEDTSGQGSCSEVKNTIRENIKNSLELEGEDHEDSSDDDGSDAEDDSGSL